MTIDPSLPSDNHLDVYLHHSVLQRGGKSAFFQEGPQNKETKLRYERIVSAFKNGFLPQLLRKVESGSVDFLSLAEGQRRIIASLVNNVTSEMGRAVVGLCFLQLSIKSVAPDQSIRLHKGGPSGSGFSWTDGISMRSLDKSFTTPFLRDTGLLKINRDGVMMTRTLAENYPYTELYKASIRGAPTAWMSIVNLLEDGKMDATTALAYLMSLLKNRTEAFRALSSRVIEKAQTVSMISFEKARELHTSFFHGTTYSARAMEVAMHSLVQALEELGFLRGLELSPLSQMRSANKKAGNVGDIEMTSNGIVVQSWDAKFGKAYLWDELEELHEKLQSFPDVQIAGFVSDRKVDTPPDLLDRKDTISQMLGMEIHLLSFRDWVSKICTDVPLDRREELGKKWIATTAESFGRKRAKAPIDEPCEKWLLDFEKSLDALC